MFKFQTETLPDGSVNSSESCVFNDVAWEQVDECQIANSLQPVRVDVTKRWFDAQLASLEATRVRAYYSCSGTAFDKVAGYLDFYGVESCDSFEVFPDWDGGTICSVDERVSASSVESDDSDCQDLNLTPGQGAACTITNTRFYEGIPALSPYGLAALALMMLGIGLIGFRRYG